MSYDMSIGEETFNYTYNVAPMWYAAAPGKGIRAIYGLTGKQALPVLRAMRSYMEENWNEMLNMNPSNKWGSAEGAREFLSELIVASINNPEEIWEGD